MGKYNKDVYRGRQMVPKDTVSQKKMDRQVDRLDKRIDHFKQLFAARLSELQSSVDLLSRKNDDVQR